MGSKVKPKTIEAQEKNVVLPIPLQPKAWRVEIDEFLADTKMTNLFLLALQKMQTDGIGTLENGKVDWWTYHNLSSIHSYPQEDWNGIKARLPLEYNNKPSRNYCRHGSVVFPTWHRAYVYQFEQAVGNQMRKIADTFTDEKVKYQNAARRFRLPYWDPFMPRNEVPEPTDGKAPRSIWGLPKILSRENVYVRNPDKPKDLVQISNPLHHFTFPDEEDYVKAGRERIDWKTAGVRLVPDSKTARYITVRTPDRDGKTNLDYLEKKIQSQAQNSATKVWHMLNPDIEGSDNSKEENDKDRNEVRTWESFSNHIEANGNAVVSIESWHDNIHVLVGQGDGWGGHMTRSQVAAFDPIFWLHHCNIDRILALFQSLYPKAYVLESGDVHSKSELYPFMKDTGKFYTSEDLKDWKKAGFAMPGNAELDEDSREIVKEYVRNNYYWWVPDQSSICDAADTTDARATDGVYPPESLKYPIELKNVEALRGAKAQPNAAPAMTFDAIVSGRLVEQTVPFSENQEIVTIPKDTAVADAAQIENEKRFPEGALQDVTATTPTKMVTWNAHITIKKHAFDGSFAIHLFIGDVNDHKSSTFMTRGNEVGFSGIFTSNAAVECANCERERASDVMYVDVIPITSTLFDYLEKEPKSEGLIRDGVIRKIKNMEPGEVVPFLKEHLKWRIVDPASNLIDGLQQIKDSGLEVKVVQRMFETPNDTNKLGVYSDPVVYEEVTRGQPGGFGYQWPA